MRKLRAYILYTSCAIIAATGASAAQADFYLGLEGGLSDIRHKQFDDDTMFQGYAGWKFFKSIGVELAYTSLGEFEVDLEGANSSVEVDQIISLAVVFSGEFLPKWKTEANVKVGLYDADVDPDIPNGLARPTNAQGWTIDYGIAQPIGENFAITFNWQYFDDIKDVDFMTYSLGARFTF